MEEREEKSGGAGCVLGCAVLFLLLPLYVFSIGPAAWLADKNPAMEGLMILYYPIGLAGVAYPPLGNVLEWYLDFWQ